MSARLIVLIPIALVLLFVGTQMGGSPGAGLCGGLIIFGCWAVYCAAWEMDDDEAAKRKAREDYKARQEFEKKLHGPDGWCTCHERGPRS